MAVAFSSMALSDQPPLGARQAGQPGARRPQAALGRHCIVHAGRQAIAVCDGDPALGICGLAAHSDVDGVLREARRLGVQTVALKQYIDDLYRDFSAMLSSEPSPERVIAVEGIEVELPAATAIPLGFIASELITNATKYGTGRITVRLEANPAKGYALSVTNDGPALPQGFDPAAGKGLGMRIIRSLVGRIGGELRIDRGDNNQGARFTVLFS